MLEVCTCRLSEADELAQLPLCAVLDVCLPMPPRKKKPAVCGSTEEDPNAVKRPNIASKEEEQEQEPEQEEQEEQEQERKKGPQPILVTFRSHQTKLQGSNQAQAGEDLEYLWKLLFYC